MAVCPYQDTFVSEFLKFYPNPFSISKASWYVIIQFWHLDLSLTAQLYGRTLFEVQITPRFPPCMLRSYLLSIKFKLTSITRWIALFKENPLFAILSGFQFGDTPGVGTFYDFFSRLWDTDSNHLSPKKRHPRHKVKKGNSLFSNQV